MAASHMGSKPPGALQSGTFPQGCSHLTRVGRRSSPQELGTSAGLDHDKAHDGVPLCFPRSLWNT